jgi:hypothetical protein
MAMPKKKPYLVMRSLIVNLHATQAQNPPNPLRGHKTFCDKTFHQEHEGISENRMMFI